MKLGREVSRHNELANWRNTHRFESVMATKWLLLTISETEPGLWDRLIGGWESKYSSGDMALSEATRRLFPSEAGLSDRWHAQADCLG